MWINSVNNIESSNLSDNLLINELECVDILLDNMPVKDFLGSVYNM